MKRLRKRLAQPGYIPFNGAEQDPGKISFPAVNPKDIEQLARFHKTLCPEDYLEEYHPPLHLLKPVKKATKTTARPNT